MMAKQKKIKCEECGKLFKGAIGLSTHQRRAHGKVKKVKKVKSRSEPEIRYQEFEIPVKLVITVKVESQ